MNIIEKFVVDCRVWMKFWDLVVFVKMLGWMIVLIDLKFKGV